MFDLIDVGSAPNAGDGDPLRAAMQKINEGLLGAGTAASVATAAAQDAEAKAQLSGAYAAGANAARNDAVEIVTGGTGSLVPAPGKLPIADGYGRTAFGWSYGARIHGLLQNARQRPVRVLHGGTSIEAGGFSGTQHFIEDIGKLIGLSGNDTQALGVLGGSYDAAYLGWKKQPCAGYRFTRLRGESSSSPLVFARLFKKMVVRYSTESGGGSFAVLIDGVSAGTIDCSGPQSVNNEFVVEFDTAEMREVTFNAPASGYVYVEAIDWCLDNPGLHVLDTSFGGSSLNNFVNLRAPIGSQVAGIALSSLNVGIDGLFANTSEHGRPDLVIAPWCVNDAGVGMAQFTASYAPAMARLVAQTKAIGADLLIIVEMGGAYTMANHPNHATFVAIRNLLLSYAGEQHVTVIDWHGESRPDLLSAWATRYYPTATYNEGTGTVTGGDFIHPVADAHALLRGMLNQAFGVPTTGIFNSTPSDTRLALRASTVFSPGLDLFTENSPPGRVVDKVDTFGVPGRYTCIGNAVTPYENGRINTALWYSADQINYFPDINDAIAVAGTADEFGPYKDYTLTFFLPPLPDSGQAKLCTVTVVVGPGSTQVRYRNAANSAGLPLVVNGKTIAAASLPSSFFVNNTTDKPQAFSATMSQSAGLGLALSGRLYGVYITSTEFACVAPRAFNVARELAPPMFMVGDLTSEKLIVGQSYLESINSKTIEKVCIGRDVVRPGSANCYGLYRLADKTGITYRRLVLQNVAATTYDARLGASAQTSAANPNVSSTGAAEAIAYDKTYTLTGRIIDGGSGIRVWLYDGGTNTYIFLQPDLTWAVQSYGAGAAVLSGPPRGRKTVALTFNMPSVGVAGAGPFAFVVANFGPLHSGWTPWVLCEGSSAVV